MRSAILLTAGLGLMLAAPALAQTTASTSGSNQPAITKPAGNASASASSAQPASQQSQPATPAIQQAMKHDLQQAGFTDVQIMPESFLIRAHDRQGRPVMMVVNPNSVVAMTKASVPGGNSSSGGGSGSGGFASSK